MIHMGDDFSRMEDFSDAVADAADMKAEQTRPPQNNMDEGEEET